MNIRSQNYSNAHGGSSSDFSNTVLTVLLKVIQRRAF